jgi:hypothetical protein
MVNKTFIISLFSIFLLYNAQVTILGPPSVVNKVKEFEDGSKYFIYYDYNFKK